MRLRTLGRSGLRVSELCLGAWQLAKPEVTSVIIGARTAAQLEDNLAACEVAISPEVAALLEEVTAPSPVYPGSMIAWVQRGLDPSEKR